MGFNETYKYDNPISHSFYEVNNSFWSKRKFQGRISIIADIWISKQYQNDIAFDVVTALLESCRSYEWRCQSEMYSEPPCQTSKMDHFMETANDF